MSFALYALGNVVLIGGVISIAHLMHIPQAWIVGIAVIMLGFGLVTGVRNTRRKDPN